VGQGFGFYESSGGIGVGQTVTIRAYVNNNKAAGLYQGSYQLQEIQGSTTIDVGTISYNLTVSEPLPVEPSGLNATAVLTTQINLSQINLSWTDNSDNEAGFKIERKIGATGTYAQIAMVNADITNFDDTGLAPNTTYYYKVRAYNGAGDSGYSNEASATTEPEIDDVPPIVKITSHQPGDIVSKDGFLFSGTAIDNDSGIKEVRVLIYDFYRQKFTVNDQPVNYNSTTKIWSFQVQPTHITAGAKTKLAAYAYDNAGNACEEEYLFVTVDGSLLPAAPSGLNATVVSSTQINLSWADNSNNEDGFKIERKTETGATGTYAQIGTVGANVTTFNNTGLTANTTYSYRVRAYNVAGDSGWSNEVSATTSNLPPVAPSGLTATAVSTSQINLSWQDNSTNETGFKIERKTGATGTYAQIGTVGVNVKTFNNTGLTANAIYYYKVKAYNATGDSGPSNEASATTPTINTLPFGHFDVADATQLGGWALDSDTPQASIKVRLYRDGPVAQGVFLGEVTANKERADVCNAKGAQYKVGDTCPHGFSVATSTYPALLDGKTHTVYAYAIDNPMDGSTSEEAHLASSPKTFTLPLDKPSNLTATAASSTEIVIKWDYINSGISFRLERALASSGPFSEILFVDSGGNSNTYLDSGLNSSTTYYYRVRAEKNGIYSDYADPVSAKTLVNNTLPEVGSISPPLGSSNVGDVVTFTTTYSDPNGWQNLADVSLIINTSSDYSTGVTLAYNQNTNLLYMWDPVTNAWTSGVMPGQNPAIDTKFGKLDCAKTSVSGSGNTLTVTWKISFKSAFTGDKKTYLFARDDNGNATFNIEKGTWTITAGTSLPAPSNLVATALSSSQIKLTWTINSSDETGFSIERHHDNPGPSSVIPDNIITVGPNVTTYTESGLAAGKTYWYRVRAVRNGTYSSYSNNANAKTPDNTLIAPSNLVATAGYAAIALAWNDNSNDETSFSINRYLSDPDSFSPQPSPDKTIPVGANIKTYSDTGLTAGKTYWYKVRAVRSGTYSNYSNTASAKVLAYPPIAPSVLKVTAVSATTISLEWIDNSFDETGFEIQRDAGGGYINIATVDANVFTYSNTGLTANTTYYYRVRAERNGTYSPWSNRVSATTNSNSVIAPEISYAIFDPQHFRISVGWFQAGFDLTSWRVERAPSEDPGSFTEIANISSSLGPGYYDYNIISNTTYYYRVRTERNGVYSSYSNTASATTPAASVVAPSNLVATALSSSEIKLTWQDNSSDETSFSLERHNNNPDFSPVVPPEKTFTLPAGSLTGSKSYIDSGLIAGTQYWYKVRAERSGTYSGYAYTASATTLNSVNNPPTVASFSTNKGPTIKSSAVGEEVVFYTTFSDLDGWQDINAAGILINTSMDGAYCFYGYYDQNANRVYLRNDDNTDWAGSFTPGSGGSVANKYAKLRQVSVTGYSGDKLLIKWYVTFKNDFIGTKNIYVAVTDDAEPDNIIYAQYGTWTINAAANSAPKVEPISGSSAVGEMASITTVFSDLDGWQDIKATGIIVNTSMDGANCFYAYYDHNADRVYLRNEANSDWVGSFPAGYGAFTPLKNKYVTLLNAWSTGSGDTLTVEWVVTFNNTFTGTKNIYLGAVDKAEAINKEFQTQTPKGTWKIN
ncbi:MAG: fibronectin type III domain-containing protein, partial [Candidatus Omnitrophota bacterium]